MIGLFALGCRHEEQAPAAQASIAVPVAAPAPAAPSGPVGEQLLDTSTPTPRAPIPIVKNAPKPGSDDDLPSWVPLSGRLTVVEAPDLAENLGVVPKGATKSSPTRISVVEQLAQQEASRPRIGDPVPPASQVVAMRSPRHSTWLASNGRVRGARRAR
ncbi:MAG: hypothetical protein KF819_00815 [Labilithrix sp.]|nr:hypothetical protein [Labilithrix sp.]